MCGGGWEDTASHQARPGQARQAAAATCVLLEGRVTHSVDILEEKSQEHSHHLPKPMHDKYILSVLNIRSFLTNHWKMSGNRA